MIRNQEVVAGLTREIELRNMSDTRSKNKRNADFLSTFENSETKEGHCSQQFRPSVQKFAHEYELNKMADVRFGNSRLFVTIESTNTREVRCLQQPAPPAKRLMHGDETNFIKDELVRDERRTGFVSVFESSNTRDGWCPEQPRPYVYCEPVYVHDNSAFNRDTNVDNLDCKFYHFTKITKPRQTLNYFIGEFERLNATVDHTKYNTIVGKWVPKITLIIPVTTNVITIIGDKTLITATIIAVMSPTRTSLPQTE